MRICVIGTGYVGLVTGTCLADSGNHVACVDSNPDKVRTLCEGISPQYEPGLEELMKANMSAERLRFTTDLAGAVRDVEVVFFAVGTPPAPDGSADLSVIEFVADQVGRLLSQDAVVVVKSTVPVGTCARVAEIIAAETQYRCPVVSNPEFLKEGDAVNDFLRPDRIVIGADEEDAGDLVEELYRPFVRNARPIIRMSRGAAELTKYAANAYLAMRISFINEIAEICEEFAVDVNEVRAGIGTDARIGRHFMYPGIGYGGSCFPKDVRALAVAGREAGACCGVIEAVHERNEMQRRRLIERIHGRLGERLKGRTIAVWGLAFKPKTDDVRDAPAIAIIEDVVNTGGAVAAHDPRALDSARKLFDDRITYHDNAYAALENADALVICTEWNGFRSPDFRRMHELMNQPLVFDGRNLYELGVMRRHDFEYHSVGRPTIYRQLNDATQLNPRA